MKAKLVYLIMACFVIILAETAFPQTQAAFYGYVYYHNCNCSDYHHVWIRKAGENGDEHRVKCGGNPGYSSDPYYYTAGWYYISVIGLEGTGCDVSYVQYVYYSGTGYMQVNLNVYGPQGGGSSPEPEPGP